MPEFDGVKNFDREKNGLVPLRAEIWEKFVFVNLDPTAESLDKLFRRIAQASCAA